MDVEDENNNINAPAMVADTAASSSKPQFRHFCRLNEDVRFLIWKHIMGPTKTIFELEEYGKFKELPRTQVFSQKCSDCGFWKPSQCISCK
jgi:hypothetical protein